MADSPAARSELESGSRRATSSSSVSRLAEMAAAAMRIVTDSNRRAARERAGEAARLGCCGVTPDVSFFEAAGFPSRAGT